MINPASPRAYTLAATQKIPNSPFPLLHYKKVLAPENDQNFAVTAYDTLKQNGWEVQWLVQYGYTQRSHYHSRAHEAMAVLSGTATIRFGVADTSDDDDANTTGQQWEEGGIELKAEVGDVFVIPAGVAHKSYNCSPSMPFERLTPGDGKGLETDKPRELLAGIHSDGFTMIGSYPEGAEWDFVVEEENQAEWQRVWSIPPPPKDPMLGDSEQGLCGKWKTASRVRSVL